MLEKDYLLLVHQLFVLFIFFFYKDKDKIFKIKKKISEIVKKISQFMVSPTWKVYVIV